MKILLLFPYKLNKNGLPLIKRHSYGFSPNLFFRYTKYMEKECRREKLKIEVNIYYSVQSLTLALTLKFLRSNRWNFIWFIFILLGIILFLFFNFTMIEIHREVKKGDFFVSPQKWESRMKNTCFLVCLFVFVLWVFWGLVIFNKWKKNRVGFAICMFKSSNAQFESLVMVYFWFSLTSLELRPYQFLFLWRLTCWKYISEKFSIAKIYYFIWDLNLNWWK